MKREEITRAAQRYGRNYSREEKELVEPAFEAGVKWAKAKLVHKPTCLELTGNEFRHQLYGAAFARQQVTAKAYAVFKELLDAYLEEKDATEKYIITLEQFKDRLK